MTDEAALKRKWAFLQTPLMHSYDDPTKPSQQAVNGAFDSYVEGGKKDKKRPTPFGFSVLRHATDEQLLAAMPFVRESHGMSNAQVKATLAPRAGSGLPRG